ncbi:MAG: hypothetical protein ACREHC_02540 [Candidatus Levyibacteriota bacterium]
MASKRPPIEMNNLTENLKTSKGRGADAFFASSPTPQTTSTQKTDDNQDMNNKSNETMEEEIKGYKKESKENNILSNITILQFTEKDIEELREPAEKVQTYRLAPQDIEYIRDAAYKLSKESKRGKIGQGDILRIAIVLFDKFITSNKTELKTILDKIK